MPSDAERSLGTPPALVAEYVIKERTRGGRRMIIVLLLALLCFIGVGGVYRRGGVADGKVPVVEGDKHTINTTSKGDDQDHEMHTYFLLDRTGSMASLKKAVEDGYEAYVVEQQASPGKMFLTVAQFDATDPFEVVIEGQEIHSAARRLANYEPRSTTPLYDAIESTIQHAEKTSAGSKNVIIVVFTDGQENASRKATRQSVFAQIEEKKKRGWTFVFLGANQDSFATGGAMGYSKGSTMNYAGTAEGVSYGWGSVSKAMLSQRAARARPGYTSEERVADAANYFGRR